MSINGLPTLLRPPRKAQVADEQLPGGPKHIKLDAGTSADRLNAQLWTGGAITTDQEVEKLEAAGVTADIDNRKTHDDSSLIDTYSDLPQTPQSMKTHPLLDYLWNGVLDDGEPKPVSWFSDAWMFAKPILDKGGVIYSHCAAGHNRGPSIAYFLLRAYWGLSPQAALDLIHTRRPETVGDVDYAPDADAAIVELGLVGANHEEAEKLPVPAAVPDPIRETARYYGLSSVEMRLLHQLREDGGYNADQPRASNGEWTSGDESSTKLAALVNGEHVTASPQEAVAIAKGLATRDAPVDLSNLHVTGVEGDHLFDKSAMEIPRSAMPRIPSSGDDLQKFAQKLNDEGIKATVQQVSPLDLHATQNQLDGVKAGQILGRMESMKPTTLIVDRDGNLLDGHHRWAGAALYAMDGHPNYTVSVLRCDANVQQLLTAGHEYNAAQGIQGRSFESPR